MTLLFILKIVFIILFIGAIIYFLCFKEHKTCWGITKKLKFCRKSTGGKLLCDQHKNRLIIYLISLLFTIFITFLPDLYKLLVHNKLIITPRQVALNYNGWSNTTPITVTYNGNEPIYSVWIKISIEGKINIDSISFTFPEFKEIPEVQFSKIIVTNKVFIIKGSDAVNKDAIYLCLDEMHQNSNFDFIISGQKTKTIDDSYASLKILSFDKTPANLFNKENEAGFPFKSPPENIILKSITVRMRKID